MNMNSVVTDINMAAINGFVVFSGLIFLIFILGFHNFLTNNEENGCEMTHMFEYPQFVRIAMPINVAHKYSRYGLYAYGEGHVTEVLRHMQFFGIPVLFIPGNSGSYKQVRSLASVSLWKTLNSRIPFHFDYFAVDLNEEYSGLFGGVLKDQRDFVHHCIRRILSLYKNNVKQPSSVILIGHSMGGMIAKGLFVDPNFDSSLVRVIITLVTPHSGPVLALDSYTAQYYDMVNGYWKRNRELGAQGNLSHVTVASIGGGHRDVLVRSGLTLMQEADINVVSTAIPTVWLSTDHLCSVWCKELVLVIVRALFDIVNFATKQVTENVDARNAVFRYHLLQRTAGKKFSTAHHPREVYFDHRAIWNENLLRKFTFHEPYGVRTETHIMIRLLDDPKHEMLSVEAFNLEDKDWVFACTADNFVDSVRMCNTGINLSNETEFLSTQLFQRKDYNLNYTALKQKIDRLKRKTEKVIKRKIVHLNLAALKQKMFTHVVLRVKPTNELVTLKVDVHSSSERHITVTLPKYLSFMTKSTVLETTADNAGYYELALPGFEQVWQAYLLHVQPRCEQTSHHAIATMKVPWSREDVHAHFTEIFQKPLHLKLQAPKPPKFNSSEPVKVRLVLDPTCRYTIRIQSGILDSLGQLARFYSPMLLPYLVCILLLTLRYQLQTLVKTGRCVMFHSALGAGAKPYYVLPVAKIGSRVLGWSVLVKLVYPWLPLPDAVMLQDQNLDFIVLPLYLFIVAYATAYLLGLACWLAVIFSGHTAHKMALRFLARTLTGTITFSEWAMAALSKLPAAVAAFLIVLNYRTCGGLSMCVGGAFFFLKLCKMYEEYLEDLFKYSLRLLLGKRKKNNTSKEEESKEEKDKDESKTEETSNNTEDFKAIEDSTNDTNDKKESETENEDKPALEAEDTNTQIAAISQNESCNTHETAVAPCTSSGEGNSQTESDDKSVTKQETETKKEYSFSELHFCFTTLLLWLSVTLVNVPSVLVWAHNYKFNVKLESDPSFETSLVMCFCIGILWQEEKFPKPGLRYYSVVIHSLYFLAVLCLTHAQISLYHLGPIVAAAFVIMTVHQLVAGMLPLAEEDEEESTADDNDPTSSIKAKIE